ncbi:hypothetical protein P692DRAFT_20838444 [Suillus brevipes Sb2]|nr:hypothetical protein P692DRAFT_20838444 [Suillus brevipes Sb2]
MSRVSLLESVRSSPCSPESGCTAAAIAVYQGSVIGYYMIGTKHICVFSGSTCYNVAL